MPNRFETSPGRDPCDGQHLLRVSLNAAECRSRHRYLFDCVCQRTDHAANAAQAVASALANGQHASRTGFIDMFPNKGLMMNTKYIIAGLTLCAFLGAVVALADEDSDKDRSHPGAFVKDSAITTKIKTKLAAEHLTNMGRIHVDTDKDGVVWLSGSARTQDAIDEAVSIARSTERVKSVRNDLIIKKED